jgi:hypothetical protein
MKQLYVLFSSLAISGINILINSNFISYIMDID